MAGEVFEEVTGTAAFVAIKPSHYGFRGSLIAKSTNGGSILVRLAGSGAAGTALVASGQLDFDVPIDLNKLEIKGNGYVLILSGKTNVGW